MRPVPQVEGKTGMNLFMCIPPDHMRDDLPSAVTVGHFDWRVRHDGSGPDMRVYVGVTDDMGGTVTLPCFDVQVVDGKCVLMAHRTGRPVA